MKSWPGIGGWGDDLERPRPGSLEARASLALKILAGINVAGIILGMIPGSVPVSMLHTTALSIGSGALAAMYLTVAWALERREEWAISLIRPLLVVLLVWGTYTVVAAFAGGAVRIPFIAVSAGWALLGGADRRPLPRPGTWTAAALVVSVVLIAVQLAGQPLFGWGGFFDVHERDLTASVIADCGPPGEAPPERISITYEWRWTGSTILANEGDEVIIGWNGDDDGGHPLYVLADTPEAGDGITAGSTSDVDSAIEDKASRRWRGWFRWGIDLKAWGISPGRIELILNRAADRSPDPQSLVIGASYIHVGAWRSDASPVTCSWHP
jgi:hypothetical protein